MSKKQVIIIVVLILFVAAVVVAGLLTKNKSFKGFSLLQSPQKSGEKLAPAPTQNQFYVPEVPKDAKPTPPKNEAPASPNPDLPTKQRFFDLKATNKGFDPSSITVNKGDNLQIDFSAVDGDYDIDIPYLGVYFPVVKKGTTRRLPFSVPQAGTFVFLCRDFCPQIGPIQGQIIVLP